MPLPDGHKQAAVLAILRCGEKLLLLKRDREPNAGRWTPVGGKVEAHEAPEDAAVREVFEETGLIVKRPSFCGLLVDSSPGAYNWICFVYRFDVPHVPPPPCDEGTLAWVELSALASLDLPPSDGAMYAYLRSGRPFHIAARYDEEDQLVSLAESIRGVDLLEGPALVEGATVGNDSYHIDDGVHEGQIYDALNRGTDELSFYLDLATEAGGEVLELACGTGRLTIPLAEAGIPVVGLDYTASMLARAKEKARRAGVEVSFLRGDMRAFAFRRPFSFVFLPFNSLQCLYDPAHVVAVLNCVADHLEEGSLFAFDVFNPDLRLMVDRDGPPVARMHGRLEDGRLVRVRERCRYDSAGQVNRVTWLVSVDGGPERRLCLDMRCFYPREIEAILDLAGWEMVARYGDFEKGPFRASSPKQIILCRPRRS